MKVARTPNQALAHLNGIYLHPEELSRFGARYARVGNRVYAVYASELVQVGYVAMNHQQRAAGSFVLDADVSLQPWPLELGVPLESITFQVSRYGEGTPIHARSQHLAAGVSRQLTSSVPQILTVQQQILLRLSPDVEAPQLQLVFQVLHLQPDVEFGRITPETRIQFTLPDGPASVILDHVVGDDRARSLFHAEVDFSQLGIGGLDAEFNRIFRRAFASRVCSPEIVRQMGIHHVRGMLLYGPPGCGKTLLARQIGRMLNSVEPKIVNGPEILDKYVGGSEQKVRELFAEAEADQRRLQDRSPLHIIILDELDAICRQRGSTSDSTGVHDSIVNQLLSKIDGVESLDNIILIGMTNRKDMIDDALLRPGRLELHIEIGLPDEPGRLQILNIHTRAMRENRRLSEEAIAHLSELAARTKNYSGAELEGLVKNAASYAFNRTVDLEGGKVRMRDMSGLRVEWPDLLRAQEETVPAFGICTEELDAMKSNIIDYGSAFRTLRDAALHVATQLRDSTHTASATILLSGDHGTGKTALAAHMASLCNYPFVRIVTADAWIGLSEQSKCQRMAQVFRDSFRSPLSIILLDDLERLIEYSGVGMRYSNAMLQTLLVMLRKRPPQGHKLLVIGTTSCSSAMTELELSDAFSMHMEVEMLDAEGVASVMAEMDVPEALRREVRAPIGIKNLILQIELAQK